MKECKCNWKHVGKIAAAVLAVAAVVAVVMVFRKEIVRFLTETKEKLPIRKASSELDDFEDV